MKLFEPIQINGMQAQNRIVMPALQLRLGLLGGRSQAFYKARAEGGVGTIIISGTSVDLLIDDNAWGRPDAVKQFVDRTRTFTEEIHQTGARIGIQIWHGNFLPAGKGGINPDGQKVAPSARKDYRALTVAEIQEIIDRFARASRTAQQAGLDFVEIHGAHGYLVCQFFSGADNQRSDRYGGDLTGRMQFGIETVRAVRQAVGADYPIFYRLGATEDRTDGLTLAESCQFAAALETAGTDALDISIGKSKGFGASPGPKAEMGTFVHLAEAVKGVVSIPVMGVGRINTGQVAEEILSAGRVDLVGIGRQLIADPQWPNKVQTGQPDTVEACLSCNTCFTPISKDTWRPGDRICKVNDRAGREIENHV